MDKITRIWMTRIIAYGIIYALAYLIFWAIHFPSPWVWSIAVVMLANRYLLRNIL